MYKKNSINKIKKQNHTHKRTKKRSYGKTSNKKNTKHNKRTQKYGYYTKNNKITKKRVYNKKKKVLVGGVFEPSGESKALIEEINNLNARISSLTDIEIKSENIKKLVKHKHTMFMQDLPTIITDLKKNSGAGATHESNVRVKQHIKLLNLLKKSAVELFNIIETYLNLLNYENSYDNFLKKNKLMYKLNLRFNAQSLYNNKNPNWNDYFNNNNNNITLINDMIFFNKIVDIDSHAKILDLRTILLQDQTTNKNCTDLLDQLVDYYNYVINTDIIFDDIKTKAYLVILFNKLIILQNGDFADIDKLNNSQKTLPDKLNIDNYIKTQVLNSASINPLSSSLPEYKNTQHSNASTTTSTSITTSSSSATAVTFKLMTYNVFMNAGYYEKSEIKFLKDNNVTTYINNMDDKPDIICTQEEPNKAFDFTDYKILEVCPTTKGTSENVAVYYKTNIEGIKCIRCIREDNRHAIIFEYMNITVANLHLDGGRFIDTNMTQNNFDDYLAQKLNLLNSVLRCNPDIIVGDFNSVYSTDEKTNDLFLDSQYTYLRNLNNLTRDQIIEWNNKPYSQLKSNDYKYAIPTNQVEKITNFRGNTIVDTIWHNKHIICENTKIIDTFSNNIAPSDHNPVITTVTIKKNDQQKIAVAVTGASDTAAVLAQLQNSTTTASTTTPPGILAPGLAQTSSALEPSTSPAITTETAQLLKHAPASEPPPAITTETAQLLNNAPALTSPATDSERLLAEVDALKDTYAQLLDKENNDIQKCIDIVADLYNTEVTLETIAPLITKKYNLIENEYNAKNENEVTSINNSSNTKKKELIQKCLQNRDYFNNAHKNLIELRQNIENYIKIINHKDNIVTPITINSIELVYKICIIINAIYFGYPEGIHFHSYYQIEEITEFTDYMYYLYILYSYTIPDIVYYKAILNEYNKYNKLLTTEIKKSYNNVNNNLNNGKNVQLISDVLNLNQSLVDITYILFLLFFKANLLVDDNVAVNQSALYDYNNGDDATAVDDGDDDGDDDDDTAVDDGDDFVVYSIFTTHNFTLETLDPNSYNKFKKLYLESVQKIKGTRSRPLSLSQERAEALPPAKETVTPPPEAATKITLPALSTASTTPLSTASTTPEKAPESKAPATTSDPPPTKITLPEKANAEAPTTKSEADAKAALAEEAKAAIALAKSEAEAKASTAPPAPAPEALENTSAKTALAKTVSTTTPVIPPVLSELTKMLWRLEETII